LGRLGTVQAGPDARGEVEVQVGTIKVRVPLDDLRHDPDAAPSARAGSGRGFASEPGGDAAPPGSAPVPASIHLRGMTVDDAILALDKYLDDASLAGLPFVTVIHGKGTGTLRRALHEFLSHHPHAKSFRLGGDGEGGSGATIVTLAAS
jgi:DNA mismatch repair protein MutS2